MRHGGCISSWRRGIKQVAYQLIEVGCVGGHIVGGGHDLVGYGLLLMYDVVKGAINGASSYKVVAGDVVLLTDTMGTVFTLATIGISPWKFNECHIR